MMQLNNIREGHADKINSILVHQTYDMGCHVGRQMAAEWGGLSENFLGKCLWDVSAVGIPEYTVTDSNDYVVYPANQVLLVRTGANVAATAGVIKSTATSRSYFNMGLDDAASAVIGFSQDDSLPFSGGRNIDVRMNLASLLNLSQLATEGFFCMGLMAAEGANFLVTDTLEGGLANAPSADFVYIEIAQGCMRLVSRNGVNAIYSPRVRLDNPTGPFTLTLRWGSNARKATAHINEQKFCELELPANHLETKGLQFFSKVGHKAAYAGNPMSVAVEGIQVTQYLTFDGNK